MNDQPPQKNELTPAERTFADAFWNFLHHHDATLAIYEDREACKTKLEPLMAPWGLTLDIPSGMLQFDNDEAQTAFVLAWL